MLDGPLVKHESPGAHLVVPVEQGNQRALAQFARDPQLGARWRPPFPPRRLEQACCTGGSLKRTTDRAAGRPGMRTSGSNRRVLPNGGAAANSAVLANTRGRPRISRRAGLQAGNRVSSYNVSQRVVSSLGDLPSSQYVIQMSKSCRLGSTPQWSISNSIEGDVGPRGGKARELRHEPPLCAGRPLDTSDGTERIQQNKRPEV